MSLTFQTRGLTTKTPQACPAVAPARGSAKAPRNPVWSPARTAEHPVVRLAWVQATEGAGPSTATSPSPAATASPESDKPTVTLRLRKPVGIVFAQKPEGGPVYVDELTPGGNADATGKVAKGDLLVKCSATVLKAGKEGEYEAEGYGQRIYDNWSTVMFDCTNQEFKTVMSALKSNNERWGIKDVTLVFQKP